MGTPADQLPDENLLASLGAGGADLALAFVRRCQQVVFGVAMTATAAMAGIYGMTARQIADAEGIPLGTAKTRIRDGTQKLCVAYLLEGADDE